LDFLARFKADRTRFLIALGAIKFSSNHKNERPKWRKASGFSDPNNDSFLQFYGSLLCRTLNKEVVNDSQDSNSACALLVRDFYRFGVTKDLERELFRASFQKREQMSPCHSSTENSEFGQSELNFFGKYGEDDLTYLVNKKTGPKS
jgi:hypothetical protein